MEDLIKRDDAKQAVCELLLYLGEEDISTVAENVARDIPSADSPQGEWIRDRYWSRGIGMGEEYGFFYKCSLCEYEVENGYTRCGFNFCPNCGADMRKGADDE